MTLECGDFTVERGTLDRCDTCGQQEVEGLTIDGTVDPLARVCIDCFTRALRLPSDELVQRLQVLLRDVEASLSRGFFPSPDLFRRLRAEVA